MPLKWVWIVLFLGLGGQALAQADARRITVTGEGWVDVAPDMATVTLGVTSEAQGAREAIDDNSQAMAAVLERLRAAGIEERDLQTADFTVSPRFDYSRSDGRGEITGFLAQNTVSVRVRDLEKLGEILDAVARDGANNFQNLSFGLQNPEPVEDAAREAAVAEARRKAELYARAAGVSLGALMTLSEEGGAPPQPMMMQAEMRTASDSVPMAAGEVSVTSRVTLVYAIE
jgi:uncharacterized protein YggE